MKRGGSVLLLLYIAVQSGVARTQVLPQAAKRPNTSTKGKTMQGVMLNFQLTAKGPRRVVRLMVSEPEDKLVVAVIINPDNGKTIQTLSLNLPFDKQADTDPSSVFQDVNFDGYTDLVFFSGWYAAGNTSSSVWLFDRESEKYEFNAMLSDLTNLGVDPATRTISTGSTCCAGLNAAGETYRWQGKELKLIQRTTQQPLDPQPKLPAPAGCT